MHPPQPTTRHSSFLHSLPHKASPSFEALSSPTCSVRTTTTAATAESPCSSMASGRTAHWELAPRIPLFPLNLSGDVVSPSSHASSSSASSSSCSTLGFLDVFAPNTASFPRSSSLASLSSSNSSTPSSKSALALPLTPSPTPPRYIHAATTRRALSCLPEEREPNSTPVSIVPKRVVSALQLGSPFRSSASCTDFTALAALGKADSEATVQSSTSLINAAARLEPSPLSAQLDSMHTSTSSSSVPAIVTPPTANPVLLISPAPSSAALEPSPRYLASIFSASSAGDSPAWGAPVGVRPTPPPRPPRRRPVSTATLKSITPAAEDEQSDAGLADASDDAGSTFGSLDTPQQPRQAIHAVAAPRRQKRTAEQFRKLSNAREQHYRSSHVNGKERSTSAATKPVRPSTAGSHAVRPRSRHASTHSRVHAGCALGLPMAFRLVRKKRKMRVQDLPSMQVPLRVELPEVTVIKGQAEVVVIARQAPTSPNTRNLARKPVVLLAAAESQTPLLQQAVSSPVQPPPPAPRLGSKKWTADSSPSDAGSPTWLPLPPVAGARVRKAKSQLIVPSSGSGTSQRSSSDSNGRSSARRVERSSSSQRSRGGASSTYDDMQMVAGSLLEAAASSQASLRSSQPSPTSSTAPRSSLAPPVNEAHLAVKAKRSSRLMRALSSMSLRPHAASSMEQQRASMDIGAPSLVSTSASLNELDCRAVFDVHGNGKRTSASISRAASPAPKPTTSLAPPPTLPARASSRASETAPEAALPTPVVQPVTPPRLASRSRVVTPSNAAAEQGEALVLAASDSSNLLATYEGASLLLAFYAAQLGIEEEGADATVAGASMRNSSSADRAPSFGSGSANASPSSSSGASATSLDSDLYDGRRLVRAFWNEGEDGSSDSRRGSGDARSFVAPPSPIVPLVKAKSQQLLRARVDPLQVNTLPFPAL